MSHINKEKMMLLYEGSLPLQDRLECLEHIAECNECAEVYTKYVEENSYILAPKNMKERILYEASELKEPRMKTTRTLSKRRSLILYSMKIGVAVAASVAMVFATSQVEFSTIKYDQQTEHRVDITEKLNQHSRSWVETMQTFTNLFNKGDFNND